MQLFFDYNQKIILRNISPEVSKELSTADGNPIDDYRYCSECCQLLVLNQLVGIFFDRGDGVHSIICNKCMLKMLTEDIKFMSNKVSYIRSKMNALEVGYEKG